MRILGYLIFIFAMIILIGGLTAIPDGIARNGVVSTLIRLVVLLVIAGGIAMCGVVLTKMRTRKA